MKMHLSSTDYGNFLQNEPSPISTTTLAQKTTEKLVEEFNFLRMQAVEPLATFLDYITYGYMIDNIILVLTGTSHNRSSEELLEKCHPLGLFDSMATLCVTQSTSELYRTVLVDTPLGPYFGDCISLEDLDEVNIEIIRNTLYKAYLEDFHAFCMKVGGETAEVMGDILKLEADRRAINITVNSLDTDLDLKSREKLYPTIGLLYPEGTSRLIKATDLDAVRSAIDAFPDYRGLLSEGYDDDKTIEDQFFELEVNLNRLAFEQQFHYGAPGYAESTDTHVPETARIRSRPGHSRALSFRARDALTTPRSAAFLPSLHRARTQACTTPLSSSRSRRFATSCGSASASPRTSGGASTSTCPSFSAGVETLSPLSVAAYLECTFRFRLRAM